MNGSAGVAVRVVGLVKRLPAVESAVLDGLNLMLPAGSLTVLCGPSGAGKTTLLRILAGLDTAEAGEICFGDQAVQAWPPAERNVAMMFQADTLYPHLSVRENLAFGLRCRGEPSDIIGQRVTEIACRLELTELLGRRPGQLSGGQRRRVALGRALVRRPMLWLLDEPLTGLDRQLRRRVAGVIAESVLATGTTTLLVSHDPQELPAELVRVLRLADGRLTGEQP